MSNNTLSVAQILERWPSRSAIHADAMAVDAELKPIAVSRWKERNSVPPKYWRSLINGAERRGFEVTSDELADAHSEQVAHAQSRGSSAPAGQGGAKSGSV